MTGMGGSKMLLGAAVLAGYLLITAGCGSGNDGKGGGPEAKACNDAADAIASTAERCGDDPQANRKAFVDVAAGGDCDNIVQVRDATALYDVCIPFLQNMTCEQWQNIATTLPPECESQLLR